MLKNYIKIAWKVLLRRKFFTFISLFGISFTLAILMVVSAMFDHVFGAKAPLSKRDRMLLVLEITSVGEGNNSQNAPSYKFLKDYVKTLKTPELVSIYTNLNNVNAYVNQKKLVLDQRCTDDVFWQVTDFTFLEGNGFKKHDMDNANKVVVINESTKKEYFGTEDAIGKTIILNGKHFKVCGVVKDVSVTSLSAYADVWIPLTTSPARLNSYSHSSFHGECNAMILGKDAASLPLIKDEFKKMMEYINNLPKEQFDRHFVFAETFPEHFARGLFWSRETNNDDYFGKLILITFLIILFFILLPSINLVNINISRIMERSSEIGARRAFGATQKNLISQFLIENIFLTLIGCLIGFVIAFGTLEIINTSKVIAYAQFDINWNVFLYGVTTALVFGVLSGVYPAYKMSRLQPVKALKGGAL